MTMAEAFSLLGGVGLFLFGMQIMSTGLKNACGDNLQHILEKATTNKFVAVLVGLLMTILVQSSSATDVMVIGFVNSGLMSIAQAIGVIMGANIGTTITAQITAFNISTFTPLLLCVGTIMYLFMKKSIVKHVGSVIMGFGMLFQGIIIMKAAIAPLSQSPEFIKILSTLDNKALAVLFGIAFTALLQSSSSATVIFQAFLVQGLLEYNVAVYLIIGAAIGSVTPNLLASLTANRNGKRTAILNLLFNVIRAAILITIINVFPITLEWIKALSPDDVGRQLANTHTIFAITAVLIELPFTKQIIALAYKIIPLKDNETQTLEDRNLVYMTQMENIPANLAIHETKLETARMGQIAIDNLEAAMECFYEYDAEKASNVQVKEDTVNILNRLISDNMSHLKGKDLSSENVRRISCITIALTDIERISDHAINIVEYAEKMRSGRAKLSDEAREEIQAMASNTIKLLRMALDTFREEDYSKVEEIESLENQVDIQEDSLINNHIQRLMQNGCDPLAGVVFSDIVTDLERCSDHGINITYAMKERPE